MKTVRVQLDKNGYDINIGIGLLGQIGTILNQIGFNDKLVIITDNKVKALYGNKLKQDMNANGFKADILDIPEGEEQKSLETAGRLYYELTNLYAERNTPVLALGGGVIGDLAGFVAATFMRGVPLVQIPTTLLSQGDSSIGGKVAVNHGQLKNKIGAFYHPKLTITDINTLKTLSAREISNGMAEIIKHGAILDADFFSYIENNIEKIRNLDEKVIVQLVTRSAEIKAGIVEKDELDLGLRNVLNNGHNIGHAIEAVSGLKVWHGEAVAIGMLTEARISNKMDILDKSEVERLKNLIIKTGLPTELPDYKIEDMMQAVKHDKKVLQGKLRFALLKSIGEVYLTDEVSLSLVEEVLNERDE
jgi:3-dehydroquinate synthase